MNEKQQRIRLLETQIRRVQKHIDTLEPRSNRYSWIRVFLFFGALIISIILLIFGLWIIALPLFVLAMIAFTILAHFQSQIDSSIARHTLWRHIKSAHIARMKIDWEQIPPVYYAGSREGHPFEFDLDITGNRSLHHLLNTAISREGMQRLQSWLLATEPDLETIAKRQALVQELAPLTRFRDRLTLNALLSSRRVTQELEGQRLLRWLASRSAASALLPLFWLTLLLNILTPVLLVMSLFVQMPALWGITLLTSLILFFATANSRGDVFEDAGYLRYGFATLSRIFSYLETYPYGNKLHLKRLCAPFYQDHEHGPSQLLKKTARVAAAGTLRRNPFLWLPINVLMPWDLYCAYRLRQYKEQIATRLPVWLDTWYELEALCSLAAFAYLNPEYILPQISPCPSPTSADTTSCALFRGRALGHPLLPAEKKVTNDFTADRLGEVMIITGSNMAGKSTFLRTLGLNLCLAYAGGSVNAQSLECSLFRLFTCIRVTDSVTDGYSYFYAEVRRLRALLDALNQPDKAPLFFLVDEIFKGTNNRERLIGSRSFIRALTGRNCIGAISTHDLELVKLEDVLPQVKNMHFREEVIEGKLAFDYILRCGPCPTTNALKIMELEGLPIEE